MLILYVNILKVKKIMRKINFWHVLTFNCFLIIILMIDWSILSFIYQFIHAGDFRPFILIILGMIIFYILSALVYRTFMILLPLPTGIVTPKTKEEFSAQISILFQTIIFLPILRWHIIPDPLSCNVYRALGTKLGEYSFICGIAMDPTLVSIGKHTILGFGTVVYCHGLEGDRFTLHQVRIGDHVTVGVNAVIMPDVVIADRAIIAAGAVVTKGARIGVNEIWAGVPAQKIGTRQD